MNNTCALCAIGRLENAYAEEFVKHYLQLGFKHIYLYDNNHGTEEHFEDVLQRYIDEGDVTVINFRDQEKVQLTAYNHCYKMFGKLYGWMAFFDFDEFLTFTHDSNIEDFLSRFKGFSAVKINWMIYDDNDLVLSDCRPLQERFTHPMPIENRVKFTFPENNHCKAIVRTGLNISWMATPHFPCGNVKTCNPDGVEVDNSPFQPYTFKTAYLKHFTMKTIDEFLHNKMKRGVGDRTYARFLQSCEYDFFNINKLTEEKKAYLRLFNTGQLEKVKED